MFDLPDKRGVAMASYIDKAYLVDNTIYSSGLLTNKYDIDDFNKKPDTIVVPPVRQGPVPIPSVRDTLPEDLEAEIAAALGDASNSTDLLDASVPTAAGVMLESDTRQRATVIRVDAAHVFVSLGGANEGVVQRVQLSQDFEVGAEIDIVVSGYNQEHQIYDVRIPGASVSVADWADLQEGVVVDVTITGNTFSGSMPKALSVNGKVHRVIFSSNVIAGTHSDHAKLQTSVVSANLFAQESTP